MTASASAGTTFHISAGVPATFDVSGYEALSFTQVGEVLSHPGGMSVDYNIDEYFKLADTGPTHSKTSFSIPPVTVGLKLDTDDAGQILCKAAALSTARYAVKTVMSNGDVYYNQILMKNFMVSDVTGGPETVNAAAEMQPVMSSTGVVFVEDLAA